jgi:hypothetical protein
MVADIAALQFVLHRVATPQSRLQEMMVKQFLLQRNSKHRWI